MAQKIVDAFVELDAREEVARMKILIFSPYWLFLEGFASFFKNEQNFELVGETSDESELFELASSSRPDVVLMDIDYFEDSEFVVLRDLTNALPEASIIVFSSVESEEDLIAVIANGAKGFLSKTITKSKLIASLKALQRGEAIISRKMVMTIVTEFSKMAQNELIYEEKDIAKLTYREFEVLKCLENRATNREIAKKLFISENTVRVHVHNILKKLNAQNRREAAYLADRYARLEWKDI